MKYVRAVQLPTWHASGKQCIRTLFFLFTIVAVGHLLVCGRLPETVSIVLIYIGSQRIW